MLVLSRKKNEKLAFPGLGITVEILSVRGGNVRVGVEAPLEVRVMRDELLDDDSSQHSDRSSVIRLPRSVRHELRNALHELSLMLHVYQKRHSTGTAQNRLDAESMFETIVERIQNISEHGMLSPQGLLSNAGSPASADARKALVVDDDDNERELLAGFLRMCDYEVDTATDGLEAFSYLESQVAPDVILLDMQMPRCDGVSFLRRVRERSAWNPIDVFVISGSSPEDCGVYPDDGFARWFPKPLDPRKIVAELSQLDAPAPSVA